MSADTEGMAIAAPPNRRTVGLTRHVRVPLRRVVAILEATPERVVGHEFEVPPTSQSETELAVDVAGIHVSRPVRVGFGKMLDDDGVLALPIWWEAADHSGWYPTFDGGLEVRGSYAGTELRLVGSYEPPLGPLGRFADNLLGHRLVLASLEGFLTAASDRLTALAAGAEPAGPQGGGGDQRG
jgi:hypothetical protein